MDSISEWVDGYRLAWETGDAGAVVALFSSDARYRSHIFEEPHQGRAGIERYWQDVTASQSDVTVRMGEPFVDGSRVAVEFWTNMHVDGDAVTLPGCLLLQFDENWLCTDLREYWHFQPGTYQPPTGWGG
jgi:hypothetical protein